MCSQWVTLGCGKSDFLSTWRSQELKDQSEKASERPSPNRAGKAPRKKKELITKSQQWDVDGGGSKGSIVHRVQEAYKVNREDHNGEGERQVGSVSDKAKGLH